MNLPSSPEEHEFSPPHETHPERVDNVNAAHITQRDIDQFAAELELEENQGVFDDLARTAIEEGSRLNNQALLQRVNEDIKAFFESVPSAEALDARLPDYYVPFDPGTYDDRELDEPDL